MPFPKTQAEINALLQNWRVKLKNWASLYGLTTAFVDQIEDDALVYDHLIKAGDALEKDLSEFYAYKESAANGNPNAAAAGYPTTELMPLPTLKIGVKYGIVRRNRDLYNFLRLHPNRTDASLADLGIGRATRQPLAVAEIKPTLGSKPRTGDGALITFNRQGRRLCRIQMRRENEDWTTIIDADTGVVEDETPSVGGKPEKREYRGIYLEKNKLVGQYSDIIVIYTTP